MKSLKRSLYTALSIVLCCSALTGCGSKQGNAGTQSKKNTIVYGISSSPTGIFNPIINDTTYDDAVCELVYNSLLKFDKEQKLEPSLAEEYDVSKDGLKLIFTLKNNLKWSDGKPLTAKDVAFTFESLANKDYPGEFGDYVSKIIGITEYKEGKTKNISGIKVLNDNTIELNFTEPYGPALTNLGTLGIIPKHVWSKIPESKWKESKETLNKPIGSGPYKLVEFKEGQDVKFTKNNDYFEGKPKTDDIIFKVINEDTVLADLKNKNVDIADVSNLKNADREELKKNGFNLYKHSNNLFQYMGLNYRNPIFKDIKVRQAFMYSIDRKSMVDKLLEGNGVVMNIPMLTSSWAYPRDDKNINKYPYDKEKAKKLLSEAGYNLIDGVMTSKDGKKLEFTLDVPTGNTLREQAAQAIQENLKDIGVKVNLNKMEFPALMEKVVGNHDFDMYMMGNNLTPDPDLTAYWSSKAISNKKGEMGWNISGFSSKELDDILKQGTIDYNIDSRKKIYKKFAEYMNKEVPWIYLFEQDIMIATNPNLKGFDPSVFRDFSDAQNWKIEK